MKHSYQAFFQLVQWIHRKRLKCNIFTDDDDHKSNIQFIQDLWLY